MAFAGAFQPKRLAEDVNCSPSSVLHLFIPLRGRKRPENADPSRLNILIADLRGSNRYNHLWVVISRDELHASTTSLAENARNNVAFG
jgi:hypothetical protein